MRSAGAHTKLKTFTDAFCRLVFPQFLRHISQRSLMSAFELKGTDLI